MTRTDADQIRSVGYALDSRYTDRVNEPHAEQVPADARDVNSAISRPLKTDRLRIVMVTRMRAARRRNRRQQGVPITYNAPKPKEITVTIA